MLEFDPKLSIYTNPTFKWSKDHDENEFLFLFNILEYCFTVENHPFWISNNIIKALSYYIADLKIKISAEINKRAIKLVDQLSNRNFEEFIVLFKLKSSFNEDYYV